MAGYFNVFYRVYPTRKLSERVPSKQTHSFRRHLWDGGILMTAWAMSVKELENERVLELGSGTLG